jgi:hypothetical protein
MFSLISSAFRRSSARIGLRGLAATAFFAIAFIGDVHPAAALTLGDVICNVASNIQPLSWLFNGIAYIGGSILIGHGLYGLKEHAENPAKPPLHQAIARLTGGAGLLALPGTTAWLVNTLFGMQSGGGLISCGGVSVAGGGGNITLDVLLTNLVYNIKDPFTWALSLGAITFGIFLIIRGLIKASKFGTDPKAASLPVILGNLTIGTVMVTIGQSLDMMLGTMFGTNFINPSTDVLSWNAVQMLNAGPRFTTAIMAALTFFQMIGIIAFIRGWLIVKNAIEGTGQATMVQGFTHIIGGVLAINIYGVLEIFDTTFGTNLL